MSRPTIEEQIKALAVLRHFVGTTEAYANNVTEDAALAIEVLDKASVFAALDQERDEREATTDAPRVLIVIEKLCATLFQAQGADGKIWATATTRKKVEERLTERPELFMVVSPEELAAAAGPGQTYDTPRCKHCSDPLDENGGDLYDGETFCGANPDSDRHEPETNDHVGLPTLAHGEEIRPAFSDTHPRAARELGEMIAANEKHRDTYTVHPDPNEEA